MSQRDEQVTFFVDASLGRHVVPGALRWAGVNAVAHHDCFPEATPDETWLTEAGRQGWLVLMPGLKNGGHPWIVAW